MTSVGAPLVARLAIPPCEKFSRPCRPLPSLCRRRCCSAACFSSLAQSRRRLTRGCPCRAQPHLHPRKPDSFLTACGPPPWRFDSPRRLRWRPPRLDPRPQPRASTPTASGSTWPPPAPSMRCAGLLSLLLGAVKSIVSRVGLAFAFAAPCLLTNTALASSVASIPLLPQTAGAYHFDASGARVAGGFALLRPPTPTARRLRSRLAAAIEPRKVNSSLWLHEVRREGGRFLWLFSCHSRPRYQSLLVQLTCAPAPCLPSVAQISFYDLNGTLAEEPFLDVIEGSSNGVPVAAYPLKIKVASAAMRLVPGRVSRLLGVCLCGRIFARMALVLQRVRPTHGG